MKIIVTGGAGFIGSAVVRNLVRGGHKVLNIDKLTYAGNLENLALIQQNENYQFLQADICEQDKMINAFHEFKPDGILHLAAESHVDRSIDSPRDFLDTNIFGTYSLLEAARTYRKNSNLEDFKFVHVSTDEVYGSLGDEGLFTETTRYKPNSPYSASKASSDLLARAWNKTYDLPVIITNCSNNYGPYHFPEKLIPLIILNALEGKKLPVYGDGSNIRDWLYVEDHADALSTVLEKGVVGENYNIGGHNEKTNLYVVQQICEILDELSPHKDLKDRKELIEFVKDRPGHDQRYAIDSSKIQKELGWKPAQTFETGLRATVKWYLDNRDGWVANVLSGDYQLERLGKGDM